MKQLKFITAIALLFSAVSFTSCTNDLEPVDPAIVFPNPTNPNPTNPNPTAGVFKADIDGVNFSTSTTMVYISGGSITITAIRPQGDNFGFMLNGTTTGTYAGNDENNLIGYNAVGVENTFISFNFDNPAENTGAVVVTEINTVARTISGTFQFKGYSEDNAGNAISKQFTNGVFTNLPYMTTNPSGDTFFAKVNGVEFVDVDLLGGTVSAGGQEYIFVSAANAADDSITVNIRSNLGVGTHSITTGVSPVQVVYAPADEDFGGNATSGTVTITQKTATRIKGTFSTTVTVGGVNYAITQGAFDVEYD